MEPDLGFPRALRAQGTVEPDLGFPRALRAQGTVEPDLGFPRALRAQGTVEPDLGFPRALRAQGTVEPDLGFPRALRAQGTVEPDLGSPRAPRAQGTASGPPLSGTGSRPESEGDSTDGLAADAACGYWERRGLTTGPGQAVAAPGADLLLTALLAAVPGDVVLPRPAASWHGAAARLLGRRLHSVPVPAECGGVPDPFLLLETVRRARAEGPRPRVLLLSVADDPTGTAAPPELLHEVCEAADAEGMLVISDESWRDTCHHPHDTVVVSPAEMLGAAHADAVVVLAGLDPALLPPGSSAAAARMPATPHGRALAAHVRHILQTLHATLGGAADEAAACVLDEPDTLRERRAADARAQGRLAADLHDAVTAAGGLCRPPTTGRHVYLDLEPVREAVAVRGVPDALTLEAELVRRLGPHAAGGHRFGDDPQALRARLTTSPGIEGAADRVRAVLAGLTEGSRR